MYSTKINALRNEYEELISFCHLHNQISFEMYIDNIYKKSLLLSAASYFEYEILCSIRSFAGKQANGNAALVAFVDNKALKRQYHTYFSWEGNNANQFFGLFGEQFKQYAMEQVKEKQLKDAEKAFIELGRERNRLVHQNYCEASVNYTFGEIYSKYEKACTFVSLIKQLLDE